MSKFSAEWKAWREAHNMSQEMFAKALGLSRRAVQGIESGSHKPSYTSRGRFDDLKLRHERNGR